MTNDIDWDDPEAIAKARGDYLISEEAEAEEDEAKAKAEEDEAKAEAEKDEAKAEGDEAKAEGDEAKAEEDEAKAEAEGDEAKAKAEAEEDEAKAEAEGDEAKAEGDEAKAEEDEAKAEELMIPKRRYDSQAKRTKDLEAELAKLKAQQIKDENQAKADERVTEIDKELDALDAKLIEAIADNQPEDAAKLRREMRTLERERMRFEMRQDKSDTTEAIREELRLDMVIDDLEKKYTQFQKDTESFDQELVDEVLQLQTDLQVSGRYTPSQALLKAVELLVPEPAPVEPKKPVVESEEDQASKRVAEAEKKAEERRQAALKKAVEDAGKQPPDTSKAGDDSDKNGLKELPDPNKLSDADFDALPAETLRRMRGDYMH